MRRTLVLSLAVLALGLVALPALAGIHYKAVTTTEGDNMKPSTTQVEAWVDGLQAKVEFRETGTPGLEQGTYMITKDGGKTLFLVDPKEKTYAEWDLQAMLQTFGNMLEAMQPILNVEIENVQVEPRGSEAGPTLHGLATTRHAHRTSYDMRVKVLGMGRTNRVETDNEVWSTTELDDPALGVWLRSAPVTGLPGVDELVAKEMEQVQGFPLKTVARSTTTGQKGKRQSTTVTTMEVTELDRSVDVPAATFEIPEGYTRSESTLPAGEEGEEGGNPFGKLFGGGR